MVFNPAMYSIHFSHSFSGVKKSSNNQKQCGLLVGVDSTFLRHDSFQPHLISNDPLNKEPGTWLHYEANAPRRYTLLQVTRLHSNKPSTKTIASSSVITSVTFILAIMIMTAQPGTKNIAAQYVIFRIQIRQAWIYVRSHRTEQLWVHLLVVLSTDPRLLTPVSLGSPYVGLCFYALVS